jgi:glycosyltransferase involved in cell wall biosynthesis
METGVMAKPGDIIDLVSKIKLLLSNDDLRMKLGENAYQYVRENHNWTTLASKYVEIYKEALSGKGGSHESRQRL